MKKSLSLILASVILACAALTSCSEKAADETTADTTPTTANAETAADTETDELASLAVNIVLRKLVACIAEFGDRHFFAVELVLLDYSTFDRHTVVVPAGNIRCVIALHRFEFHDEVLEYLVHCGAHVDISVGEGRTVMKNKLLMSLIFLQHEGVEIYFVPIFEHFRLALGKIGAHGEGC